MKRSALFLRSLTFFALFSLSACQTTVKLEPPTCNLSDLPPNSSARSQFETFRNTPSAKLYGCMLAFWNNQTEVVQPIVLKPDGNVQSRTKDSEDAALSLDIPANAKQQTLLFRMYLLQPSQSAQPTPLPYDAHRSVCQKMIFLDYDCFKPDNAEKCWLALAFQPKATPANINVYQLDPAGNTTCKICSPEVCDGKDNNCNGITDEFDEENGRTACPITEGSANPKDGGTD